MDTKLASSSRLAVSGVSKRYGRRTVLANVDLQVHAGEAVALVGENGCGKSTLLKICAGLIAADAGTVEVHGRIGYCPQEPGLFDQLNAAEHLDLFGARGENLLADLGLAVNDPAVATDLSGGSQQKLNLALAILGDPSLLLLDEPYQGFDRGSYLDFWRHVAAWRDEGRAVLVVTHALADLDRVDHVVELPARIRAGAS